MVSTQDTISDSICWPANAEVDVVALNWHDWVILWRECKWGADPAGRSMVRKEKAILVDWQP
jgi:hypothetical protein